MVCLFDLDSLLYHSVYRIVSITQMKELLAVQKETRTYKERKELAFNYIVDEAVARMGNKLLKVYNEIEETGIMLTSYELYITNCKNSVRKEISPYYNQFIMNEMATGKFNNEAEIIQAGLALLEKEQTQMSILTKAILDGEKSGFALPFNNEDFKKRMEAKYAK